MNIKLPSGKIVELKTIIFNEMSNWTLFDAIVYLKFYEKLKIITIQQQIVKNFFKTNHLN